MDKEFLDTSSLKNISRTCIKLKQGTWAYFLLLIFEGALRKWILPGLATPLLLIRDPLAICCILVSWHKGYLPSNLYIRCFLLIGIIGIFTALFLGHGNLSIALYGSRIFLVHFPMMFVIGAVFDRNDVLKIGKAILYISIPMAVLIGIQFYSPQSAWVNRGVGGDINGAGFSGALGYFRPPGTFSFTTGTSQFFGLLAPFVCFFWLVSKDINRLALSAATASLLAAIPFSISRSLLLSVLLTFVFAVFGVSRKPKYIGRMVVFITGAALVTFLLSSTNIFHTATEAFSVRFQNASNDEGGVQGTLSNRYFGHLLGALIPSSNIPFFGYGLGLGTNVASMLLTGQRTFIIAEEEWPRMIGELGPLIGLLVIFVRLSFCFRLSYISYNRIVKGDFLPWLLLSYGLLIIPQGQWAQPTTLGFSTLIGGLIIASLKVSVTSKNNR